MKIVITRASKAGPVDVTTLDGFTGTMASAANDILDAVAADLERIEPKLPRAVFGPKEWCSPAALVGQVYAPDGKHRATYHATITE